MLNKRLVLYFVFVLLLVGSVFASSANVGDRELSKKEICYYENFVRSSPNGIYDPLIPDIFRRIRGSVGCDCIPTYVGEENYELRASFTRSDYGDNSPGTRNGANANQYCFTESPGNLYGISAFIPGQIWERWNLEDDDCNIFGDTSGCELLETYYPGELRECTEDSYTDYGDLTWSDKQRNLECASATPFCENDYCHNCIEDSDCENYADNFLELFPGGFDYNNAICRKSEYNDISSLTKDHKYCNYCQDVIGTGGTVVTIVSVEYSKETVDELVSQLLNRQPYRYLVDNGKLKFQYADMNIKYYVNVEYYEEYPLEDQPNVAFYTPTYESQLGINGYVRELCPKTDVVVFIDAHLNFWGFYEPKLEFVAINSGTSLSPTATLAHELGHALGDLADEYSIEDRRKYTRLVDPDDFQVKGINIDTNQNCPKFFNVAEENCYEIKKKLADLSRESRFSSFYKSTSESAMNYQHDESRYNIKSCQGILMKTGDVEENQALELCKQWACEGKVVRQTQQSC